MLLGVDVGGTFTDAVLAVGGRLVTAKAPTTPDDQSEGVLAAVRGRARARGRLAPSEVEAFAHGTTVATNALLEGEGARTVLVATAGFEDVVELGRQARADLYRLCAAHPAPLVPPERRVGARERMGPDGPLRGARRRRRCGAAVDAVADAEPEAVAVCLLHAYRHPRARARARRGAGRARCPASTSRSRTRWSARSASSSARPRPRSTPRSPPCCAPTCAGSSSARARPGCPSPR